MVDAIRTAMRRQPVLEIHHEQARRSVERERQSTLADPNPHETGAIGIPLDRTGGVEFEPGVGEVSQKRRRLVEHPREPELHAGPALGQRPRRPLRVGPDVGVGERLGVAPWNRIAMGIDVGMVEKLVDAIDEKIAHGVFHVLGLVVHLVPRHAECADEKELDEAVPADHSQGQHASGPREGHALVGAMRCQPGRIERLEHARDGAGGNAERGGDLSGRRRPPVLARRDLTDRLDVVLDGETRHGDGPGRSGKTRWLPVPATVIAEPAHGTHYVVVAGACPVPLNSTAFGLADELCADSGTAGVASVRIAGARVIDCGVQAPGSDAAGLAMARIAMAGGGTVGVGDVTGTPLAVSWPDCPYRVVRVSSETPVAACLAAQYAGWKVAGDGYFAMASGPIRAAIGREKLFDVIGHRERASVAVGLLEARKLPPSDVVIRLAADAGVPPDRLTLLVAPTASPAGTLQIVARSLETALHKIHDLGFDLRRIVRGRAAAPLPAADAGRENDLGAIGRTNDAILYGGHAILEVTGDDASLAAVAPRAVSGGSADHGSLFLELFERAGRDFYALDPALFAPAVIELVNLDTGTVHRAGAVAPALVARSFACQNVVRTTVGH
jgi:methenyltetrahydromethanopterin cyclohydrolase